MQQAIRYLERYALSGRLGDEPGPRSKTSFVTGVSRDRSLIVGPMEGLESSNKPAYQPFAALLRVASALPFADGGTLGSREMTARHSTEPATRSTENLIMFQACSHGGGAGADGRMEEERLGQAQQLLGKV